MDTIYQDIAARTQGNVYIGVVGPVRTGKSTLIKRAMETMVIPAIADPYRKERAKDELPQSGSGRRHPSAMGLVKGMSRSPGLEPRRWLLPPNRSMPAEFLRKM